MPNPFTSRLDSFSDILRVLDSNESDNVTASLAPGLSISEWTKKHNMGSKNALNRNAETYLAMLTPSQQSGTILGWCLALAKKTTHTTRNRNGGFSFKGSNNTITGTNFNITESFNQPPADLAQPATAPTPSGVSNAGAVNAGIPRDMFVATLAATLFPPGSPVFEQANNLAADEALRPVHPRLLFDPSTGRHDELGQSILRNLENLMASEPSKTIVVSAGALAAAAEVATAAKIRDITYKYEAEIQEMTDEHEALDKENKQKGEEIKGLRRDIEEAGQEKESLKEQADLRAAIIDGDYKYRMLVASLKHLGLWDEFVRKSEGQETPRDPSGWTLPYQCDIPSPKCTYGDNDDHDA